MWLLLLGSSIASSWYPSSRVNALYWYYKNYSFKVCVISFSFSQYSYYCDFLYMGPTLRLRHYHFQRWVRYIDTKKIMGWCMSLLIFSIDIQWFYYFIMFYLKLTNGEMVKWWMGEWCNGVMVKCRKWLVVSFLPNIEYFHLFYFWTQHFCSRQSNP